MTGVLTYLAGILISLLFVVLGLVFGVYALTSGRTVLLAVAAWSWIAAALTGGYAVSRVIG